MVWGPPLSAVPAAAVIRVRTGQVAQPIASNNSDPRRAAGVAASTVSRAGALVARRKRVNRSISASPSAPVVLFGSDTELHSVVTSSGNNRLVMPISLREASAENDTRL